MDIFYINSQSQKLNLSEWPIAIEDITELFKREWEVNSTKNQNMNSSKVSSFYRTEYEKNVNIQIFADTKEEYETLMNGLTKVTDIDVLNKKSGKLYCGDYYLNCYIKDLTPSDYEELFYTVDVAAKIYCPYPFWISEHNIQLLPNAEEQSSSGLDFPFDFPFDFAPRQSGVVTREIDHYTSSHFKMRFYGPCVDPVVKINGYPYQIFATLKSGEYLEIDSRNHLVTKYLEDGSTGNLYNSRSFEHSVFEKIPRGVLKFVWDGSFGIDLTLYLERSEPKW